MEEFSAIASARNVRAARRWYWRQTGTSIGHLIGTQLRSAPLQTAGAVVAGLVVLWIANMPLFDVPGWRGNYPELVRLAWLACIPLLPIADLIIPPMLTGWLIAAASRRRGMVMTVMLSVLVAFVRGAAVLGYRSPLAEVPPLWSAFWYSDPLGLVVCPFAILAGAVMERRVIGGPAHVWSND